MYWLKMFFLFFDDDLINLILDFSVKYAQQNNRHGFCLSKGELLNFLGIMLFSGYHTLPQVPLYWSNEEDKGIDIVKKCMSRNRFQAIKRNIHLSDNSNLDKDDKFSKLRPYLDAWGVFAHNLSIYEQMVPYFGRHSCKMFIKGKPVRFGFKQWCLCSSDGYLFYSIPYAGAIANKERTSLGLGRETVNNLLANVDYPARHSIFFDNFFSSYQLLVDLKNKGLYATGTIRSNRTGHCPLVEPKIMSKRERGAYDCAYDKNNKISMVRWNDNSIVTICSNVYSVEPINQVRRYNRKEKREIHVQEPNVIARYNRCMGGVDLHDNGIANYRIRVMGNIWWWPIFCNSIDSIIVNCWKLYNSVYQNKISQLDFKSYVALRLMKTDRLVEVRFDDCGLTVTRHPNKARRRCRECHSHTVHMCKRCKVHLHVSCFEKYHQKWIYFCRPTSQWCVNATQKNMEVLCTG
ncbi:unnamed protein product [Acanthoscelides obtectus]|uniref:PiggyBac transposable element-derived protein domain-containing protein n=1 Tax=Acanthoscelides obtectus TaxID=200917 RepID=A0A9P0LDZ9_ACAOB|nr:unnamed protein product [Acanthoscelides obtectus]CAK1646844.1 PiggyBac transposable element-derived protein 3 [Acanthoscelides obtectus]